MNNIKLSKRDEFLHKFINEKKLKLIAIAGTHGKTTTTAMTIWLMDQLRLALSYSVGAKIPFGDMGQFDSESEYFIYECDEFDHNFLAFSPYQSLISGIGYDHHEIFPTRQSYIEAFRQFLNQSKLKTLWLEDLRRLEINSSDESYMVLDDRDPMIGEINLVGEVNRKDAMLVIASVHQLTKEPIDKLVRIIEQFPGLSRRFERIAHNLYSDYAHTPEKIRGCLQLASELSKNIVVVYEPLTDRRQHFIKNEYANLFKGIKNVYWVPSYLAREDPNQDILPPDKLITYMLNPEIAVPAKLNDDLKLAIKTHLDKNDVVVCLSGGGGGSLDEWLRQAFDFEQPAS
jgi:UDP-N-acetylmuramate--alanine ligase